MFPAVDGGQTTFGSIAEVGFKLCGHNDRLSLSRGVEDGRGGHIEAEHTGEAAGGRAGQQCHINLRGDTGLSDEEGTIDLQADQSQHGGLSGGQHSETGAVNDHEEAALDAEQFDLSLRNANGQCSAGLQRAGLRGNHDGRRGRVVINVHFRLLTAGVDGELAVY